MSTLRFKFTLVRILIKWCLPDRSFPDFVTIFQLHWSSRGDSRGAGRGIVKRAAKIAFRVFGGSLLVDLEDSKVLFQLFSLV